MERPANTVPTLIAVGASLALFVATLIVLYLAANVADKAVEAPRAPASTRRLLRFGKIPNVSPREANRQYSRLFGLLDRKLECCQVELVLAPDYQSCVDMLERGEVDLAWLGTASYVRNRDRVSMTPIVRPLWFGQEGYRGVVFTVEATGIKSLKQLKGKRLALVDRESASGYVYPAALLRKEGLLIPADFSKVEFLGSHDAVLMAVLLGEYDAGAVFDRAFVTVADRAKRVSLRILAQTERIPGEPIVARPGLEPETVEEVRDAFLSLTPEELAQAKMKDLEDLFGFEPVTDAQYDGVRLLGTQ